jgi:hypothetical protein
MAVDIIPPVVPSDYPRAPWRQQPSHFTPAGVPKQISTGDRTILGKVSKRGNRYLRVLFVQAAWVVPIKPMGWERHGLRSWIEAAPTAALSKRVSFRQREFLQAV